LDTRRIPAEASDSPAGPNAKNAKMRRDSP
jgi:hypothetical protein